MNFLFFTAIFFFILLCVVLCGAILLQTGKGRRPRSFLRRRCRRVCFGTATAEVLKKFTGWMAFAFFTALFMLSLWTSAMGRTQESTTHQQK